MSAGRVTTVVLAAGASTRLGHPKQLVPYHGVPLLAHAARTALAAGLGPVIAVLGAEAERIAPVLDALTVQRVRCDDWSLGIGRSIAAGVHAAARDPSCEAVILMTCDQPGVTAEHLRALVATWRGTRAPGVGSAYAHTVGTPALFARATFESLADLPPASGARMLLEGHPSVPCDSCAADVDTPDDLPSV